MASRSKFGDARSKFETGPGLGRIHYKVRYDDTTSVLNVTVVECSKLKKMDTFSGKSDPFVRVYLLPGVHDIIKTEVVKKNLNPVFEENFKFPVNKCKNVFLLLLFVQQENFFSLIKTDSSFILYIFNRCRKKIL